MLSPIIQFSCIKQQNISILYEFKPHYLLVRFIFISHITDNSMPKQIHLNQTLDWSNRAEQFILFEWETSAFKLCAKIVPLLLPDSN